MNWSEDLAVNICLLARIEISHLGTNKDNPSRSRRTMDAIRARISNKDLSAVYVEWSANRNAYRIGFLGSHYVLNHALLMDVGTNVLVWISGNK